MAPRKTAPAARRLTASKNKSVKDANHTTHHGIPGQTSGTKANGLHGAAKRQQRTFENVGRPVKRVRADALVNHTPTDRLNVFVFGNGEGGELGLGSEITEQSPESAETPRLNNLLDPKKVGETQVAVGGMHCAALTHDGKVLTWGVNDWNALGRDTRWTAPDDLPDNMADLNPLESTPTIVDSLDDLDSEVVQVAACDNATFVLTALGTVYGWGTFFGDDGAFGFLKEQAASGQRVQITPVQVPGLPVVKELIAGVNHMLALTHDGDVYTWGSGQQAELGRRIIPRRKFEALVPRSIGLGRKGTVKAFAGFNHSFAIDKHGTVWSWGLNNFGQTGHPSDEEHLHIKTPQVVESLKGYNVQTIAGGFHHSLACTEDGEILAWGRCDDSQLGLDLATVSNEDLLLDSRGRARILTTPANVPGLTAHFVAAGIDNSFAIDETGKVFAWGFSENFRTGLDTDDSVERPTPLVPEAMADMEFTFAGCRGQFSVIAGPAKL